MGFTTLHPVFTCPSPILPYIHSTVNARQFPMGHSHKSPALSW